MKRAYNDKAVRFTSGFDSMPRLAGWGMILAIHVSMLVIDAQASDWPGWRGVDRNGISSETNLNWKWTEKAPRTLWKSSVGFGFSSFSVSDGRAYTLGNTNDVDSVYCLDAATGAEIWKHSYPSLKDPKAFEGGPLSTPIVDGNRVYTMGKFGDYFCFEAHNGKIIWNRKFDRPVRTKDDYSVWWGYAGSGVIVGDKLVVPVGTAGTAVDKLTGKTVWENNGSGYSGYSSPVLFKKDGRMAFSYISGHEIVAGEVDSGKVLWKTPWKTTWDQNAPDVIVSDGKLFASTGHEVGCALYDIAGEKPVEIWRNKNMRTSLSSCVLWKGCLYGFDDRQMRCIDWKTGEVRWTASDLGWGSMILADGKLIALTEKGMLMAVEASAEVYTLVSSIRVLDGRCWSAPVLSGGRLYVRNAAGDVICLDLRN